VTQSTLPTVRAARTPDGARRQIREQNYHYSVERQPGPARELAGREVGLNPPPHTGDDVHIQCSAWDSLGNIATSNAVTLRTEVSSDIDRQGKRTKLFALRPFCFPLNYSEPPFPDRACCRSEGRGCRSNMERSVTPCIARSLEVFSILLVER
jgi:hypothetical protein